MGAVSCFFSSPFCWPCKQACAGAGRVLGWHRWCGRHSGRRGRRPAQGRIAAARQCWAVAPRRDRSVCAGVQPDRPIGGPGGGGAGALRCLRRARPTQFNTALPTQTVLQQGLLEAGARSAVHKQTQLGHTLSRVQAPAAYGQAQRGDKKTACLRLPTARMGGAGAHESITSIWRHCQ